MDNPPKIDAYRVFSRLKTLADETHTSHARIELARSMRVVARYVVDDRDRQAMLMIASEVEQFTVIGNGGIGQWQQ